MKSFLGFMDDDPPEPRRTRKETAADLVRDELRSRPGVFLTSTDLCAMTGLSVARVNGAIYTLTSLGNIDRLRANGRLGRNSGQAYRWRSDDRVSHEQGG